MSKRKKVSAQKARHLDGSVGPHRDRYAAKPRLGPPRPVEAKPSDSGALYSCVACGYTALWRRVDRHRQQTGHFERVPSVGPASDDGRAPGGLYECSCGLAGTLEDLGLHVKTARSHWFRTAS